MTQHAIVYRPVGLVNEVCEMEQPATIKILFELCCFLIADQPPGVRKRPAWDSCCMKNWPPRVRERPA